jgi:hypothetical protein
MCPLPVVSSASTTLPAGSRRMLPSLVSNSTSPVSQSTSKRCGALCQSTSCMPEGMWQMLNQDAAKLFESRSGGLSLKTFSAAEQYRRLPCESRHWHRQKFEDMSRVHLSPVCPRSLPYAAPPGMPYNRDELLKRLGNESERPLIRWRLLSLLLRNSGPGPLGPKPDLLMTSASCPLAAKASDERFQFSSRGMRPLARSDIFCRELPLSRKRRTFRLCIVAGEAAAAMLSAGAVLG